MSSLVDFLAAHLFVLFSGNEWVMIAGLVALLITLLTVRYVQEGGKLFDESDTDAPTPLMDSVYEGRWRVKAEREDYNVTITITDTHGIEPYHVFEVDIDDLDIYRDTDFDSYDTEDLVRTLRREAERIISNLIQDHKWVDSDLSILVTKD